MRYSEFLHRRGSHFRHQASKVGDGVVCIAGFGAVCLNTHVWTLAANRLERKLVDDIGGYGVMHEHCDIQPLMEFVWRIDRWSELRIVVQYVKDNRGRTFICVQRGSHGWYAIARISKPEDSMLLKAFLSSRRAHDKQGFGFCASQGAPHRIYNYRPDLLDQETVIDTYGWWIRWAEKRIGGHALHYRVTAGEFKHGIRKRSADVASMRRTTKSRILIRPIKELAPYHPSSNPSTPGLPRLQSVAVTEEQAPDGISFNEKLQWYRDGYEGLADRHLAVLMQSGKLEEARGLAERMIVVLGDKPESLARGWMNLGVISERLVQFEEAAGAYRRALVLEPKDRSAWYFAHNNLGFCLNQLYSYAEAEVYCRQAINIEPAWHNAFMNLGVALAGRGEYADAARQLVQATLLAPYDQRAFDLLEEILIEHEIVFLQAPEIRAEFEKCRKLAKRGEPAQEGIHRISPAVPSRSTDTAGQTVQKPPKTIVVLDDEPALVEVLGGVLASEGYEVHACNYKRTFLKELPKMSVDLIISDINSPGMDGIQFLNQLRLDERGKKIPVIIVSGARGELIVTARLRGAYAVLLKPYKTEELLQVVRKALGEAGNSTLPEQ